MADRFRTPYVPTREYQRGSLGDLIARRGEIEAQGALQSGNAWANAVAQIGQIAGGAFQEYGAKKEQEAALKAKEALERPRIQAENEKRTLEIEKMKREASLASQAEVDKNVLQTALSANRAKGLGMLKDRPDLIAKAQEHWKKKDEIYGSLLAQSARGIGQMGFAAEAAVNELDDMQENYGISPETLKPFRDAIAADPSPQNVERITNTILAKYGDEKERARFLPLSPQELAQQADREADNKRAEMTLAEQIRHNKTVEGQAAAKARAEASGGGSGDNENVSFLMSGGTAEKLPIKVRAQAVAEAKKSGGVDGTGFVPMNGQQQTKFNDFRDLLGKAERLEQLLSDPEVASRLGPFMGRAVDFTKEWPIIGQDTTVKEAFDLFKDLSDSELRKRSGAAISPNEYERITGFTVDSSKQPDSNKTNLTRMIGSLKKSLGSLGADRIYGSGITDKNADKSVNLSSLDVPPQMVKYQGKMVPFSSLSPDLQAIVLGSR